MENDKGRRDAININQIRIYEQNKKKRRKHAETSTKMMDLNPVMLITVLN